MIHPPDFYARPAADVARDLLGSLLISTVGGVRCVCRIVETEAYTGPEDEASHAAARIGLTARNESMFGPPGTAYVYRIYGIHWCLNAVTDAVGHPAAVLIRAGEPLEGVQRMMARRRPMPVATVARGPGNLCAALGITGALDRHDLRLDPLRIEAGARPAEDGIRHGPRVGVTRARAAPLRVWIANSPFVSGRSARTTG